MKPLAYTFLAVVAWVILWDLIRIAKLIINHLKQIEMQKIKNFLAWFGIKPKKHKESNKETLESTVKFFNRQGATIFFCAGVKPDTNIIFTAVEMDNKDLAKALRQIANEVEFKKIKKK